MHVDAVEAIGLATASFLAQRGRVSVALVSAVESGLLPLSKHKVVSSLEPHGERQQSSCQGEI